MLQVAIMGYGTVGSGVYEVIKKNQVSINKKVGQELKVQYVLDLREFPGDPVMDVLTHDFEDIIYILNSCPDFIERFQNEKNEALKQYLKEKMAMLISRSNIMEEIECALPIGEDDRADYIFEVIEEIAQLQE